jgi:hypothetical protein
MRVNDLGTTEFWGGGHVLVWSGQWPTPEVGEKLWSRFQGTWVGRLDGRDAVLFSRVLIGQTVVCSAGGLKNSQPSLLCQVTQAQIFDSNRHSDILKAGFGSTYLRTRLRPLHIRVGVGELAGGRSLEAIRKGCGLQTWKGCVVAANSHWLLTSIRTNAPTHSCTPQAKALVECKLGTHRRHSSSSTMAQMGD